MPVSGRHIRSWGWWVGLHHQPAHRKVSLPGQPARSFHLTWEWRWMGLGGVSLISPPRVEDKRSFNKENKLGGGQGPVDSLGAPETSIFSPPTFSAKDIQESNLAKGQVQQLPDPHMPCLTALTVPSHPNISLSRASLTQMSSTWLPPWWEPGPGLASRTLRALPLDSVSLWPFTQLLTRDNKDRIPIHSFLTSLLP